MKLIMFLLGLTCTSFHQPTEMNEKGAVECSAKPSLPGDEIISINLFSIIN